MSEVTGPDLRARREKLGLDRRPIAQKAGITVAQLCTIEAGGKRDKVLERIATVDAAITAFEQGGVPEGTNKRRGRRGTGDGTTAADADAGEEGDPASASEAEADSSEWPPEPTPGVMGRWPNWHEFKAGDPVATSTYPGAAYEFVAYVQPANGGKPYVDLWGGKRGHEQLRAIDPTTIRKVKGRGPSVKYANSTDMKPNKARHSG